MTPRIPPKRSAFDWRFIVYNLFLLPASPLLLAYGLWQVLVKRKTPEGLWERFGFLPAAATELGRHQDPVIWIHACSAGEVVAAEPIIAALRQAEPLAHVLLSTTTRTGRELAQRRGIEVDALVYFPFDLPFVSGKALGSVKPDALVMVDTELWPNILAIARSAGVRTAVVNARISDRAYPTDMAFRPVVAWTLSNIDLILAQSDKDAERFQALGAPPERVRVLGNSKFDEERPVVSPAEAERLRLELGLDPEGPVLVAGSTREGEEEKILDAFDILRQECRELQLVIAPRHPERGDAIERLIMERGFAAYRRSRALQAPEDASPEPPSGQVRIVILDSIGELSKIYALATVVFVGGSLVPVGGHNILQPIAQGKPTLMGPWMQNQRDIADIAEREHTAITVHDPQELAEVTCRIIGSESEQQLYATRGQAMLEKHGGAAQRYADALIHLLREGRDESDVPV